MLKKILIFIGLKIAEISGLVSIPYEWVAGLIIMTVGLLLYLFGVLNWMIVGNLIDKRGGD